MINEVYNIDCIEYMKTVPDKYFDLAVVDPPYGINRGKNFGMEKFGWKQHKRGDWDSNIPPKEYFEQLFRVSENQIIWGGNYFVQYLKPTMGWVFWDKMQTNFSTSDGELAYTSFDCKLRRINLSRGEALANNGGTTIHPTQKPIKLYDWIFKNYAKAGDKIFDSHLGSGSSRIAAHKAKLDFVGCELDPDYYAAQEERYEKFISQMVLF